MKEIQIFVPDQGLRDVNDIFKELKVGRMSHYRIHGRGSSKSEEVAVGLGTIRYTPENNPRTKIEVVVRDDQVDSLIYKIADKLRASLSSKAEREGRELFEDLIVTDENIKVVLQLPSNNQRENIQIFAYNDNSLSISFLSSKGKRSSRTLALPYGIDLETTRSTYRNRILEITFNRK